MYLKDYDMPLIEEIDSIYHLYLLRKNISISSEVSGVWEDDIISHKIIENNDGTDIEISSTLTDGIVGAYARITDKEVLNEYGIYNIFTSSEDIKRIDDFLYNEYGKSIQESRRKYWLEYIRKETNETQDFSIALTEVLSLLEIKEFIPILFELEKSGKIPFFQIDFHYIHHERDTECIITLSGKYILDSITKDKLNTQYELAHSLMEIFNTDRITIYTKGDEIMLEATFIEDSNEKFSLLRLKYPYATFSTKNHNKKNGNYTIEVKHKLKKH